jgi:hypothetical protein
MVIVEQPEELSNTCYRKIVGAGNEPVAIRHNRKPSNIGGNVKPIAKLKIRMIACLSMFLALLFLGASLTSTAVAQMPGTFTPTGNMTTPRTFHTATLLLDGTVLITGGLGYNTAFGGNLSSVEVYQTLTGTFAAAGTMTTPRAGHTATLLPDGRVLIAGGGTNQLNGSTASAELYDLSTGTFSRTGDMIAAHTCHQATLLANGKVLISGGDGPHQSVYGAELYDPDTGTFSATGAYTTNTPGFNGCQGAASSLLPDGKVLIVWEEMASELYDPDTATFSATGRTSAVSYNDGMPTATLLMNGKVLVAGGADDGGFYANAELYDGSTGTFGAAGNMTTARSDQTATLLPDGTVLLVGGLGSFSGPPLPSAEIYDPPSSTFSVTGTTTVGQYHTATLLNNGQVLVAGGGWGTSTSNAKLYAPAVLVPPCCSLVPETGKIRARSSTPEQIMPFRPTIPPRQERFWKSTAPA